MCLHCNHSFVINRYLRHHWNPCIGFNHLNHNAEEAYLDHMIINLNSILLAIANQSYQQSFAAKLYPCFHTFAWTALMLSTIHLVELINYWDQILNLCPPLNPLWYAIIGYLIAHTEYHYDLLRHNHHFLKYHHKTFMGWIAIHFIVIFTEEVDCYSIQIYHHSYSYFNWFSWGN